MATNSFTDLLAVLDEKAGILESMRETLEEEQRLIIEARPEHLAENTARALEFISEMELSKNRFRTLLLQTGKELGLSGCDSLSSLITGTEPEARLKLRSAQMRCLAAADAISRLLAMNEGLLRNSLDIIDRSISLFSRLLGGCETYGAAGRMLRGRAHAGIICREI